MVTIEWPNGTVFGITHDNVHNSGLEGIIYYAGEPEITSSDPKDAQLIALIKEIIHAVPPAISPREEVKTNSSDNDGRRASDPKDS